MSKKKDCDEMNSSVKNVPEFKPGSQPHYEYDGDILNANVPWNELVDELTQAGYSLKQIATQAECPLATIKEVKNSIFEHLPFRSGARIVTMHYTAQPECYAD